MAEAIEFYFDFSSPYGYLASERIDDIAAGHGRAVAWKPFLIGTTFKTTGSQPLLDIPMKGDYARIDMPRAARLAGVAFTIPKVFPFLSVAACRAYYWLADQDPGTAKALAQTLYRAAFQRGEEISSPDAVIAGAESLGVDGQALSEALKSQDVKDRLRAEVEAGVAKGVFGSPFIFVDGEPFWGHDRLDTVDRWLKTGGW